jgi:hypothetical protein
MVNRRLHTDERGAAMFVVLMVIMILSAIGTFALANARYEVQASGFTRYRAISQDIAQFGAAAAMAEVAGGEPPRATAYITRMRSNKETCKANSGVVGTIVECYKIYPNDIELRTGLTSEKLFRPKIDSSSTPGSLGLNTITGGFTIELTELLQVSRPVAGYDIDWDSPRAPKFYDITVSSTGVVFDDANANGVIDYSAGEGNQAVFTHGRGHVIVGPVFGTAPPPATTSTTTPAPAPTGP